jgi:hypothetical protein
MDFLSFVLGTSEIRNEALRLSHQHWDDSEKQKLLMKKA